MIKIPTVKEFLKDKYDRENGTNTYDILHKDNAETCLIEFAKLHVKAALKQAIKTGKNNIIHYSDWKDKVHIIEKCYPLTNIK